MIKENAERGADLIKQVLTFARGMAGERVTVNLKHLIKRDRLRAQGNSAAFDQARVRYRSRTVDDLG
ncbi:MAG: hypothetical protein IPK98_06125 [Chloracidobacterium sp.]|nr:hypothetical protein [Chloracidobacterium sp.]